MLRELGLTKFVIQMRANQLVRELHAEEEAEESKQLIKQRRIKMQQRKSFDRLANVGGKRTLGTASIQTGLESFFASTKTSARKSLVEILPPDDINVGGCNGEDNGSYDDNEVTTAASSNGAVAAVGGGTQGTSHAGGSRTVASAIPMED
uniref:Uncharacterized protein n=2 Tax=Craspedostauros australis TaxID=1486917 RepID=A0A7R9WWD1_9STRA|mmetsp:Transcript_23814/g.66514  ORF Transcript_23814/g.66514 Transcript_23814/m.66514 type:complete len:150 (+) Transcript_23814:863-1312(+)